ncbi:alpha/beta hydrolase [Kibdelosporangium aridum]|uniref:Alpha/beta hydrolase n=1 Tax=Kibdelosporangium aridum TaxID=2030 RepID=A0A428ZHC3_KIBAR|nr:alpha/beta fold hydrolase [Kibdelosporangium aridum]RSM87492.1 alpha/beta hydrolase [Kibdelosporangium aridum]
MTLIELGDVVVNTTVLRPADRAPGHPVAVCVHGLGRDSMASFYSTIAIPLVRTGFTVVLYDLRGHGGSSRPASGYRLDDFSNELGGVIDYAAAHEAATGPLFLVGNSYGGAVALHYAYREPERIAGIAVIETGPPTALWSRSMRLAVDEVLKAAQRPEVLKALENRLGRAAMTETVKTTQAIAGTTLSAEVPTGSLLTESQVRAYPHPVLALFGGASPVSAVAPILAEQMPDCRTEVLAGHGHTVLVEASDEVRDLVVPWLADRAAENNRVRTRSRE